MDVVIDCGNCGPDYSAIRGKIQREFAAQVVQTHGAEDTLERLAAGPVKLVLVNRKLDCDYSDGMEVIRQIRADERWQDIPVMLVTNYAEHQQEAIKLGAIQGFGKLSLSDPQTTELLKSVLG